MHTKTTLATPVISPMLSGPTAIYAAAMPPVITCTMLNAVK